MMKTYEHIADRVNDWVGYDHAFTPSEIRVLVWALAMDRNLEHDLHGAVADDRSDLVAERAALD